MADTLLPATSIRPMQIWSGLTTRPACCAPAGLGKAVREAGFRELPFTAAHAEVLRGLPWHHRDPFDRMLVAQAVAERLDLLTTDARLHDYPVGCM